MLKNPYSVQRPLKSTLFHRHKSENYFIELENLLHTNFPSPPSELSTLAKYKIKLEKHRPELKALWERAVRAIECNELGELTNKSDVEIVNRLGEQLTLTDEERQHVMTAVGTEKIRQVCGKAVSLNEFDSNTFFQQKGDGEGFSAEALAIGRLTKQYNIDEPNRVAGILTKEAERYFSALVERVCADDKLTADEIKEVADTFDRFHIIDINKFPKFALLHLIYQVDTETLSPLSNAEINTPAGETVFAGQLGGVTLHEWRKERTGTVGYAGPRYVMRTGIPGLTYRVGGYHISAPSQDVIRMVDEGSLYFTNKRVIFNGMKKSVAIKMKDIIRFEVDFSGVLSIERANGKSLYIHFNPTAEVNRSHPALFNALLEKYAGS